MTEEAKRVKIAETCGWTIYKNGVSRPYESFIIYADARDGIHALVPDYFNSLDAMAEAERFMDAQDISTRSMYLDELALQFDWPNVANAGQLRFEVDYLRVRASASQRAEAFGLTLALWRVNK